MRICPPNGTCVTATNIHVPADGLVAGRKRNMARRHQPHWADNTAPQRKAELRQRQRDAATALGFERLADMINAILEAPEDTRTQVAALLSKDGNVV